MERRDRLAVVLMMSLMFFSWLPLACGAGGQKRFVKIFFPDGKSVTAELAVTEEDRARGLMFRQTLNTDEGMLFVFQKDEYNSFWMKNTLIPLDMVWLDSSRRIIFIAENVPPCKAEPCPSYGPDLPSRYVLELKAGKAREIGLKVMDRLGFVLPADVVK